MRRVFSAVVAACAVVGAHPAAAQSSDRFDLATLSNGSREFPRIWHAYTPPRLPSLEFRNGPMLYAHLADGKLSLSLDELLRAVVENSLQVRADRYNYLFSQVDLLRAQSGQAVRGVPSAPLPGSMFTGAIGAGVGGATTLSAAGTGSAAISTAGRLVVVVPRGAFDPSLLVNLSYDHVVSPLNTRVVAGSPTVSVGSAVLQSRFAQELPIGTSYSISFNLQNQASTQAHLLFNPAASSVLQVQVYQPLLNGSGLALTRRFITVGENDQEIVKQAFRGNLTTTLSNAANAYWDFIAFRRNLEVADEVVRTATGQLTEAQQEQQAGAAARIDVVTAQSQLAAARVQLVTAQTRLQQQEALIKSLITQADDPLVDAAVLDLTDRLPGPDDIQVPGLEQTLASAVERRSSVRQAELSMKNYEIAQAFTRRSLLPTLSVYALFSGVALGAGVPPALRELARWEDPEYAVGLTFSVPVFNRAAQADDIRARLETRQAATELQQTKQQVGEQARTASANIGEVRKQLQAAQSAAASSRVAFNAEQARLRAGLSTQYLVALAHRDLASAEGAEIQSGVNYAKAYIAYQVAAGGFLEQHGIELEGALRNGMWDDASRR